jgi:hypothetical protein
MLLISNNEKHIETIITLESAIQKARDTLTKEMNTLKQNVSELTCTNKRLAAEKE